MEKLQHGWPFATPALLFFGCAGALAQGALAPAELRAQAGAGAATHLDQVFRSLVQASDPAQAANAILG